jgi:putative transcriptional regulator
VRELRTGIGLSQADPGAALHVSRQTINAIEAGRYLPSLPPALNVAAIIRLSGEKRQPLIDIRATATAGLVTICSASLCHRQPRFRGHR